MDPPLDPSHPSSLQFTKLPMEPRHVSLYGAWDDGSSPAGGGLKKLIVLWEHCHWPLLPQVFSHTHPDHLIKHSINVAEGCCRPVAVLIN
jgi:hypothetical protein